MKVHELAKELDIPSKDVLTYLNEKGVEAKAAQSSVEEEAATMVRKHFGKAAVSAPKAETKETAVESKAPVQESKTAEPAASHEDAADAVKKKKKIIIVSNNANSKMSGGQHTQQSGAGNNNNNNRRPAGNYNGGNNAGSNNNGYGQRNGNQGRTVTSNNAYRPLIKPSVKPSPVKADSPYFTQSRSQNNTQNNVPERTRQNNTADTVRPNTVSAEQNTAPQNTAAVNTAPQNETVQVQPQTQTRENTSAGTQQNRSSYNNRPQQNYNNSDRPNRNYDNRNNNNRSYNNGGYNNGGYNNNNGGSYNNNGGSYNNNGGNGGYNNGNRSYNNGNRQSGGDGRGTQTGYAQRPYQGNRNNGPRPEGTGRPPYQNGQRNGNGGNTGNRPFGGNNRGPRPDGRPDNRFRKPGQGTGFTPEAPAKDTEKHREEVRRNSQVKDKKSRKDLIYEEDDAAAASKARRAGRFIKPEKKIEEKVEEQIKVISIPERLTIKDLADKMKMQPSAIIKKLFLQGQIVTVNSEVTFEEAENIAIDYEIMCEKEIPVDVIEELLKEDDEDESNMVKRPPVVCVMGHVDHGKTSLLDAIRKTNVTEREAGGITQAIGAYTVKVKNEKITFLDTPGHEAFTAMRMRGANSTDIAILVVAADDGVMPQTIEAIHHAKAANVEIIVAINKIDKPNANPEKVKQELMEYELVPTEWGGSTEFVPVSAKTGEGLDTLLETILLTAEILELKADKKRKARGLVIEAQLDKGRGPVATVLVQKGTLYVGDFVSAGASFGKVRAMIDDKGKRIKEAGPSTPVEILGLSDVPEAGEVFLAHENDKTAKSYAETYRSQHKEQMLADTKARMSLDDLFTQIKEGDLKELDLIVKADVQGSVEAMIQSLNKLSNEEIVVKCIHSGVGAITESDVTLASASNAIIIGFNVKPDAQAKATADRENVDVRLYDVIYQAIDDVERSIKGMEAPVYEEKVIGHAEVRQIFKASAIGNIAGSYVLDGTFKKDCKVRISREGKQIYEGKLASLKRFKDDVKEVKEGFECGLVFEDFDQMQELDVVEAYMMVEVPR